VNIQSNDASAPSWPNSPLTSAKIASKHTAKGLPRTPRKSTSIEYSHHGVTCSAALHSVLTLRMSAIVSLARNHNLLFQLLRVRSLARSFVLVAATQNQNKVEPSAGPPTCRMPLFVDHCMDDVSMLPPDELSRISKEGRQQKIHQRSCFVLICRIHRLFKLAHQARVRGEILLTKSKRFVAKRGFHACW